MSTLVIVPTDGEFDELIEAFKLRGHVVEVATDSRLRRYKIQDLDLTITLGGLGKVQFAVQTQYLIGCANWGLIVCAGAAGALVDEVAIGDVVVATETVEHDIRKVGQPLMPRFVSDKVTVAKYRATPPASGAFRVHFGGVASGDEDIVDEKRRLECQRATGALAVAWEGAGGARACAFSGVPFLEIRGIADKADESGPRDFALNLRTAIRNPNIPVCVLGESIGSGPACFLAGERIVPDKIVLVVPFDSLASVASKRFFYLPVRLMLRDNWDNVKLLRHYSGPIDIFGATDDTIIPIEHAESLARQITNAHFIAITGGHNDWPENNKVKITR